MTHSSDRPIVVLTDGAGLVHELRVPPFELFFEFVKVTGGPVGLFEPADGAPLGWARFQKPDGLDLYVNPMLVEDMEDATPGRDYPPRTRLSFVGSSNAMVAASEGDVRQMLEVATAQRSTVEADVQCPDAWARFPHGSGETRVKPSTVASVDVRAITV